MNQGTVIRELKRKLLPYSVFSCAFSIVIQLSSLIPFIFMPLVIDQYIPAHDLKRVAGSVVLFCGVPLAVFVLYTVYKYYLALFGKKISSKLSLHCFQKLIYQPMSFFDVSYATELAQKCSQEANSLVAVWTIDIPALISNLVTAACVFILLLRISPLLAYFQLLYCPIVYLLMKSIGGKLEACVSQIMSHNAAYRKRMQEAFRSVRMIKASQLEPFAVGRVELIQKEIMKVWGKTTAMENTIGGVIFKFSSDHILWGYVCHWGGAGGARENTWAVQHPA